MNKNGNLFTCGVNVMCTLVFCRYDAGIQCKKIFEHPNTFKKLSQKSTEPEIVCNCNWVLHTNGTHAKLKRVLLIFYYWVAVSSMSLVEYG